MKTRSLGGWACWLAVAALSIVGVASAAEVRVMISAGFYGAYSELAPAFERASGHRLVTTRGPSMGDSPEAIPARLARGEAADVVILDGSAIDELGKRGSDDDAGRGLREHVSQMLAEGQQIFRFDTFGSEAFWGGSVKLHQAIAGAAA